jgi:hypothetical protein
MTLGPNVPSFLFYCWFSPNHGLVNAFSFVWTLACASLASALASGDDVLPHRRNVSFKKKKKREIVFFYLYSRFARTLRIYFLEAPRALGWGACLPC